MSKNLDNPTLVNYLNLLTQHNRILGQATNTCRDRHM